MALLEANPHYIIYFDNVRVDEFVKSWTVDLSCNGNIGTAEIEFVYLADLAYTAASVEDITDSKSIMKMLGVIDNMTNVKIFVKNVFSQKYQLIFDGNIKGKSSSVAPNAKSLVFRATDYMAWTNRTVAPIVIPYTQSTHPSDKFIWEAQGIDISKVMDVAQRDIIGFKGKRLEEIINTVVTQALAANKIYSSKQGVAYWDGIWDRMDLMADIDPDILNKNVLDYIISPNQGSVDTMYVLLNDIFAKLMFEFYQDRDGIIRIKPPYWNEPVLKSHIIDPALIINQSESSDYDNYISRVVITGGLDENFQTAGDYASKLWTPTGAYLSDGTWETVQKSDKWVNGWTSSDSSSSTSDSSGGVNAPGGTNTRVITKNCLRFIKGQEGFMPTGNYCGGESWKTVGYGCISLSNSVWYKKHQPFPCSEKTASEIMAQRLQEEEVKYILAAMDKAGISNKIKDHQLDAMVCLAMNNGIGNFLNKSGSPWQLIKKNPENYTAIASAWKSYATQGNTAITARRAAEADMYVNGNYTFKSIDKYNSSGKIEGKVTDNNGHGYMPSFLKGTLAGTSSKVANSSRAIEDNSTAYVEFDLDSKKNGHVYKRKDGTPIVGFGNPSHYVEVKGKGVWWPSVENGIKGHIQHLSSYFRGRLVSSNQCIDPKFGENNRTVSTVKELGELWSSNSRYGARIMNIINKMLGTDLKDTEIGALSKPQYDEHVTPEKKVKIKNFFIKSTQGRDIQLESGITREYFIDRYFEKCEEELIYPEVAIAQMCEETGFLLFKGSVVYQQNNFGGIGVNSQNYTSAADWYWLYSVPRNRISSENTDALSTIEYIGLDDVNAGISVSSLARTKTATKPKYVVIDAGHGGTDDGAVGGKSSDKYYLKEKDVALWLQNRVVDILKYNKINAYHSRTNDRDIGSGTNYKQRTEKILNDIKARGHKPEEYVVVSVHAASSSKSSARGYGAVLHPSESGTNSNNLASVIKSSIHGYAWHHWSSSDCNEPENKDKTSALSSLSEKNFPGGTALIEAIHVSSLDDRKMWLNNNFTFRDDIAIGIATGVAKFLGKSLGGTPSLEIEDTNETNPDTDSTATPSTHPNSDLWNGSTFKEDLDWDDVDFSALLSPTHEEMRYGGSVVQIEQPLIKFSNAGAYYDMQGEHNADANEVLKSYAKFYMNMNNSLIHTSSVSMIGAPWLRPGFNVWVDPIYTDKIYYINGITHSGSASGGVITNLRLVHGRHREEFVKSSNDGFFGALSSEDDNIFTKNEYLKSAKNFGPVLENAKAYTTEQSNLMSIMKNCNNQGIIKAERSPYAAYYASDYGDTYLKTPTILKVNDAGKQIFTDDEWKEVTGRAVVVDTSTSSSSDSSNTSTSTVLKRGDSGDSVKTMQGLLNTVIKAGLDEDGHFGPKTESALKTFQSQSGLTVDGLYGPKTSEALTKAAANASATKTRATTTTSADAKSTTKRTFVNNGVLLKGKKGAKVKELQTYMNEFMDRGIITNKAKLALDGSFGPLTDDVVRAYQKAKQIAVDGMVGPITTAKINIDLNSGVNNSNNSTTDNGVTNTTSTNKNPSNETSAATGRLSSILFTDQYTASEIKTSLDAVYKNYAPGVVKQRMYVIEKGIIAARKASEKTYLNNNYNK